MSTSLFGEPIPAVIVTHVADEQIVAEAKAARSQAESSEANASDARWLEAERYAELHQRGWSVRRIADECGTNKSSVGYFLKAVSTYVDSERPTFWIAYKEARTSASTRLGVERSPSVETADDEIQRADPENDLTEDQLAIWATMMARGVTAIDALCEASPSPIQTRDHVRDLTLIFAVAITHANDPAGETSAADLHGLFHEAWPDVVEVDYWHLAATWIGCTALAADAPAIGVAEAFGSQLAPDGELSDAAWTWLTAEPEVPT
ncbi:MAG TPA: hypothetical protein VNQ73_14415 [Ilumatobacter sp.]|nr:hypothetical protein [Ilumatobacter sp.]